MKPDATTEEIDAVLKSGGGSGEVFKNAILKVRPAHYKWFVLFGIGRGGGYDSQCLYERGGQVPGCACA